MIDAVIFDLDGVLIDSEGAWDLARRQIVERYGGRWLLEGTEAMMGMSSTEWAAYLRDEVGVPLTVEEISNQVVERLLARYRAGLPLYPGAVEAVRRVARRWPLGLASSANRLVIDAVLASAHLGDLFDVTVSSEEVAHGKPAPDVYLEAARKMRKPPARCAVIEDSANGIRSGVAAGMFVVAIPNPDFPPPPETLATAAKVLSTIDELTPDVLV